MSYEATVSYRKGEKKPLFGTMSVESGTLTFSGTQPFTLYNSLGVAVTGYEAVNVTGQTGSAAAEIEAWYNLDTDDANLPVGEYSALFEMVATASADGMVRERIVVVRVLILPAILPSSDLGAHVSADDLENFLYAAGLVSRPMTEAEQLLDMEGAITGAIEQFLEATGRRTLIQDSEDVAHTFDPPGPNNQSRRGGPYSGGGRLLQLDDGLLTFESLTVGGVEYEEGQQFVLMPVESGHNGKPYEWVEFVYPVFGTRGSIVVTGTWGLAATLPADLKRALLCLGALELLAQAASLLSSGGLKSVKLGQDAFDFGGKDHLAKQTEDWQSRAESATNKYRLVRL